MEFIINKRRIGTEHPVYFIAEIGSNFDGSLEKAKKLISLAKASGADAVKFQHYTAESLINDYQFSKLDGQGTHQDTWDGSVFETYAKASLNKDWTSRLKFEAEQAGMDFLTTPYSETLVDYIDEYVPAYKVGSGDITYTNLIKKMASKKKPLIIATGASALKEVKVAYETAKKQGIPIALLQCNTNYTAENSNYKFLNLNVLRTYSEHFPEAVLGISDHMPGHVEVIAAVALGARIVEKHFTDSNLNQGPDHKFALDPTAFAQMVKSVRNLENALGDGVKRVEANEEATAIVQRRALYFARDIMAGKKLKQGDLIALRPFEKDMYPPSAEGELLGKAILRNVVQGEALKSGDVLGMRPDDD